MVTDQLHGDILRHYAGEPLTERIIAALQAAGKSLDCLKIDDLAPIDEFHTRGRKATMELASAANIQQWMKILDVGSGIGGPSRCLAATYGCMVTGLDLSKEYCRVASMLADMVGLNHLVDYQQGDALDLPYADQSFDAVWTQHASMNISDKSRLYGEFYRVLKPGGVLAAYDVFSGSGETLHYPVPWASEPGSSFLVSPEESRLILAATGFDIKLWQDDTESATAWFRKIATKSSESSKPVLGLHLLLGDEFPSMLKNQFCNLQEGRIRIMQIVAERK
ncbi:MAG: class I SAM-dependent methyltransferase [Geobacter sp.]|nr:class I SAM-dependent methyltransferase [Geobacter sp.]